MSDYKFVTYEKLDSGKVARIMLNRPEARNAQNRGLLVDLNDAFMEAEADDEVRVVILGGMGSVSGSIIAGLMIGLSESMFVAVFPDPSRSLTYAQLKDEVCQAANALTDLGLVAGDRVAIYMPMVPEAIATPLSGLLVKLSVTESAKLPLAVTGQLQHSSSSCDASNT